MAVPSSRDGTTQTFKNFYATQSRNVQTVKKTAFTKTKATQTPKRVRMRSSSKVYLPTRSKDSEQPVGGHTVSELMNRLKQLDQGRGGGGSTGKDASAASA